MKDKAVFLSQKGFSIIPVSEEKIPIGAWKKYQEIARTPEEVQNLYCPLYGIVTGYEDLEVVDVDLKVFSTTTEKEEFWNELMSLFKDAIYDFDSKFVITKTVNQGYHILYKTKRATGNKKLATLEGHTEAVIETRGHGGIVVMYDNFINDKYYTDIQYITDEDYFSLINICKSYNHIIPEKEETKIDFKTKKTYKNQGITPWDEFNAKNTVWDVIQNDFTIYKDTPKKTFIKRIGAKSLHSGYIFKNENLMFLHSTGTIYPAEKQISPYYAFTIKYHNGDFSASAKDLYNQGYGDRLKVDIEEKSKKLNINDDILEDYIINKSDLDFPIEVFPKTFQNFLIECKEKLDSVIDFSGCALLFAISIIAGNRFKINVKTGWSESPVVWFALVGKPGVGKSPSIKRILYPLIKENNRLIKEYIKNRKNFEEYEKLDKNEKSKTIAVDKPSKEQFIADDITLEALVDLHESVRTGVGVFKDELAGWLKDMNKYREGSDLEFWLSSWSGGSITVNRMTRVGSHVENAFIPVIGGIQPNVLNSLFTQESKDNGFIDRVLISYPEVEIPEYNTENISQEALDWYNAAITNLQRYIKNQYLEFDNQIDANFSKEAEELWIDKFNEITKIQNSSSESEYFKSMYPKQKSYIPRFAFLLNVLNSGFDSDAKINLISKKSMEGAIKLSNYFVATAKKIQFESQETDYLKKSISRNSITIQQKIKDVYTANPEFNRSHLADLLGVSRTTIHRNIKRIEEENKKKTK